jgi:release factor glutamine methyltransferase
VEIVLALLDGEPGGTVVDVGTGSGAIALALASEGTFARVIATDLSRDALDVARRNRARLAPALRAPVELRAGALLAPVPETGLRAVVSNPPYIALHEATSLPLSVRDWEPAVALYSTGEGMALTRALVGQAADRLAAGGVLALEVDARRAALVEELVGADERYDRVRVTLDLFGRERFVTAIRR